MKRRGGSDWSTGSELADMGVCEKRIALQAKHGARKSTEQQVASKRGDRAHEEFFREGLRQNPVTDAAKPWCFISSAAYGPNAPETVLLREFRDRVLRPAGPGRAIIKTYYRLSPCLCRYLDNHRWAVPLVRALLRPAVAAARLLIKLA